MTVPYRALLKTARQLERPVQSLCPTLKAAEEWAGKTLASEPVGSSVQVFLTTESLVLEVTKDKV